MIATAPNPKRMLRGDAHPEPLENGDRLSAPEFLRRYEAMPNLKKAELIEGVVYMGSPVRYEVHGRPEALVQLWLSHYEAHTPGVEFVPNTTAQLDMDNVPQPDAMLRICEQCGGQSRVDDDDYLAGAPELIVEICASSVSIDLRDKLSAYRRNGVKEYLNWRTLDSQFDWRVLCNGGYQPLAPDAKGILRSTIFPGLWLHPAALLERNITAILATLKAGLKTPAHRQFVLRLAKAKA